VHKRNDVRIFEKEVKSSSQFGYDVTLVVADGQGSDCIQGIDIIDIGKAPRSRLKRFFGFFSAVYRKLVKINGDIYHLHDPELIAIGTKLKKAGFIVVFDSHENVPKQIMLKQYIPYIFRKPVSYIYSWYERILCRKLDAVIATTPEIYDKFLKNKTKVLLLRNFPILEEFIRDTSNLETSARIRQKTVSFIGTIERDRGLFEVINSIEYARNKFNIKVAGSFSYKEDEEDFLRLIKGKPVEYLGWLDRRQIRSLLDETMIGLVSLHPTITFKSSLPVKMFEYMAAGVPVLASDFPLWNSIISKKQCGLLVNPLNPEEIASAIDYLVENPEETSIMGEKGKAAIHQTFNWEKESTVLKVLYEELLRK
jgi:glycosyltransferase involved in cell wall biosynthesis